jgi:hypothetical protein
MKNKIKVVMLPTEKVFDKNINSQIVIHNGTLKFCQSGEMLKESEPQHLYITVSQDVEPIKEGDYAYDKETESIYKVGKFTSKAGHESHSIIPLKSDVKEGETYTYVGMRYSQYSRKIITTTDPKLITYNKRYFDKNKERRSAFVDKVNIPQVQQSFLKELVANPDGKWVVDYYNVMPQSNGTRTDGKIIDEIALDNSLNTLQVLKINQDNTVNITSVEEKMYSRDEVESLILSVVKDISYGDDKLICHYNGDFKDAKNWIKKNLKL